MSSFLYFWLGIVIVLGVVNLGWAIRDVHTGAAQMRFFGPYWRSEEPFGFWMTVTGKVLTALVVVPFLFWKGLGMLNT